MRGRLKRKRRAPRYFTKLQAPPVYPCLHCSRRIGHDLRCIYANLHSRKGDAQG